MRSLEPPEGIFGRQGRITALAPAVRARLEDVDGAGRMDTRP